MNVVNTTFRLAAVDQECDRAVIGDLDLHHGAEPACLYPNAEGRDPVDKIFVQRFGNFRGSRLGKGGPPTLAAGTSRA